MNVRPWEIDRMTVDQFDRACYAIDAYLEQMKATTEGQK